MGTKPNRKSKPAAAPRRNDPAPITKSDPESGSGKSSVELPEQEFAYRRAMDTALKQEIHRRRLAEKVVRSQFQALSTTLESALKKPKPRDFLQELLRAVVRECGC